jgi:hypothetical protein
MASPALPLATLQSIQLRPGAIKRVAAGSDIPELAIALASLVYKDDRVSV